MTIWAPNAITAHHAITATNVISVPIMTTAQHDELLLDEASIQVR
jgi:hypothetical protein